MEQAILDVSVIVGERQACVQFGYPRGSFQRRQTIKMVTTPTVGETPGIVAEVLPSQVRRHLARQARKVRRMSARALSFVQRQELLDAVHQARFVDRSVPYIYATLLAENRYYASISTMYRVLHSVGEVGERRDQATRPSHVKPELCATGPNHVYAWDITKLHGRENGRTTTSTR